MGSFLRYCFIAITAAFVLASAVFVRSLAAPARENKAQIFTVLPGEGLRDLSDRLETEGFIRSAGSFRFYAVLVGSAHALKPGTYEVTSSESVPDIVERFAEGPQDITVTIQEGGTLKDVDRILGDRGILTEGAIVQLSVAEFRDRYPFLKNVKSLEGFLFPDTYKFAPGSLARVVTEKMLDVFAVKAYPELAASGNDWYKHLIIASLVEKEVPDVAEDRAIVSGIIARRLNIGMGLQIDATIAYAKCGGALLTCGDIRLVRDDYAIASPYNTYAHAGLPPTPIANPGVNAIRAAINPKKTDYLFYLSDPKTKRTIFSKDFEEHNEQRAKYLGL
ncbi:MAG: endolytic transglycosylase MltG [bacterium]|nr:endolytic transglycosylase MltG [bacterium]